MMSLLLLNNFHPVTIVPTSSKGKESDELLYTVWSLVMVRNQFASAKWLIASRRNQTRQFFFFLSIPLTLSYLTHGRSDKTKRHKHHVFYLRKFRLRRLKWIFSVIRRNRRITKFNSSVIIFNASKAYQRLSMHAAVHIFNIEDWKTR